MSNRFMGKAFAAVVLSLAVLCLSTAPAQAAAWRIGRPGISLWSSLIDTVASFLGVAPVTRQVKTTTTSGGTGGDGTYIGCVAGTPGCSTNSSTTGADPYGKP